MPLFKKRKRENPPCAFSVQTGNTDYPFKNLDRYTPLSGGDAVLYETLREAVPIIDAAIFKIIRLTGGFKVNCSSKAAQASLDEFLNEVSVGGCQTGINAFISTYFEQLLTYGNAVGEIVLSGGKVAALYNAPLKNLEVRKDGGCALSICVRSGGGEAVAVQYPELILYSVLNPSPGEVTGNSLLKGLPFVSSVLLKIYNTIGVNFERVGNVRFAVTYKPQNDAIDKAYAKERAAQVAKEWSSAMHDPHTVRDFVALGDVDIKVIGADNQILDSEIPVRQMLEQIVAKTGIPPFMFGLSWSSTERMSAQQADVLTSELEAYRRILTPVILKISNTFLRLSGFNPDCRVEWDDITLQDEVESAKAKLYSAQAEETLSNLGLKAGEEDE